MTDHDEPGHSLLLPFDTDDFQFARGVAIGMLWQELERHPEGVTTHVLPANAEMVMRIAETLGLPFSAEPLGEEWLLVTIGTPADAHC